MVRLLDYIQMFEYEKQRIECINVLGSLVEMDGKVNRTRMGRFIELKDQYGITQLVAPLDVSY